MTLSSWTSWLRAHRWWVVAAHTAVTLALIWVAPKVAACSAWTMLLFGEALRDE